MNIMVDEGAYYDMQFLAATARGELICKCSYDHDADSDRTRCMEPMRSFLDPPQQQIFHEAIKNTLRSINAGF